MLQSWPLRFGIAHAAPKLGRRLALLTVMGICLMAGAVPITGFGLTAAHAQQSVPSEQECPADAATGSQAPGAHAATQPASGPSSGTAPGGQGSTGWSGGTGGSFIGTSNHASTPGSGSRQPETITGANPGRTETPRKPC